jgi:hypothetical protein
VPAAGRRETGARAAAFTATAPSARAVAVAVSPCSVAPAGRLDEVIIDASRRIANEMSQDPRAS